MSQAMLVAPRAHHGKKIDWASFRQTPIWLLVFYSNMVFGCIGFSIVLPTLWPLLREMGASTRFLAFAVAMYSVGEGIGGIIVGRLCARYPDKLKAFMLGGMVVGLVATFCYGIASVVGGSKGPTVVLVARFFQGFDNGSRLTLEQSFLGKVVPPRGFAFVSSRLSSCAITGLMLGPTIAGPLQALSLEIPDAAIRIDGNNAPVFVLASLSMVNIAMTSQYFHPDTMVKDTIVKIGKQDFVEAADGLHGAALPSRLGLSICYALFAIGFMSMAVLETTTPVVAQELWGWGPCSDPSACPFERHQTYVSALLGSGGLISLGMSVFISCYLGDKIPGREVPCIVLGLLIQIFASLNNADWFGDLPAWRFVFSYFLGSLITGFLRVSNMSMFSQIIGPHPKSVYMGTSFFCGAVPRMFGPFVFIALLEAPVPIRSAKFQFIYEGPVPRTWLLYGIVAALNIAALVVVCFQKNL